MSIDDNYNDEKFYLKIKVFISSNGKMRYIFLNQSLEGYNNKIKVFNKLEELKKYDFNEDMKRIKKIKKELEYKEFNFIYEVGEL